MTIIKTNDFILRPLKLSDAEAYFEVMQDEDSRRNFTSVPNSLEDAKQEILNNIKEMVEKDSEYFTIEIDGEYAGNVVLQHQDYDPKSNEGRLHVWIHPIYRGRGLATKAVREVIDYGLKTKYTKIFAQCKVINKGLIKLTNNLGFKEVKKFTNEDNVEKILLVKEK